MEMQQIPARRAALPLARADRLVLAAAVGHDTRDMRIAALTRLREALGPGSVALFDDGTLAGADRVRLARACGDPPILASNGRLDNFPTGSAWAPLLTALEQRRNAYWVIVGASPPEQVLPDLGRAIASNRSFALIGGGNVPAIGGPHFDTLVRDGFPYVAVSPGLLGFAACGDGLALATAVFTRLEAALGKRAREPAVAQIVAGFVLGGEREPVLFRDTGLAVHSPGRI